MKGRDLRMNPKIRTIVHPAGELIDFETVFEENSALTDTPLKGGRFERVEYTTDAYDDGKTYPKFCNVYLPWCYDPADRDTRYDVMYYQHGNTCDPDLFAEPKVKDLLDNMFASGAVKPCILVFTTYYFDVYSDVETRKTTGDVPAGDGGGHSGNPAIAPNFFREVVEDIVPAVELRYNTYLRSADEADVRAARDHRGFSGYSRGSVCTWYILHNDFEYFRYYAPMSCMTTAGKRIRDEVTEAEVVDYLTAPMKAHPELPFFIFASNGYPNDATAMTEQLKYVTKDPVFSYGRDPKTNNIFFAVSDFPHNDLYCPYYFYNSLQVLFR